MGLGNKKRLTPCQKKNNRLKERIEQEKDEEIRAELRKGNNGYDYRRLNGLLDICDPIYHFFKHVLYFWAQSFVYVTH